MRFIEGKPFDTLKAYRELTNSNHKYIYIVRNNGESVCLTKEKFISCLEWYMEYQANIDDLIPVFTNGKLELQRTKEELNINYISRNGSYFFVFGSVQRTKRTEGK